MIRFSEQMALNILIRSKIKSLNDLAQLSFSQEEIQQQLETCQNELKAAGMDDIIIDSLDILWKRSFTDDDIKYAYETLMPVVMQLYNNSDISKQELFNELAVALRTYTQLCGNTGHSLGRETAQLLYREAEKVLRKVDGIVQS